MFIIKRELRELVNPLCSYESDNCGFVANPHFSEHATKVF